MLYERLSRVSGQQLMTLLVRIRLGDSVEDLLSYIVEHQRSSVMVCQLLYTHAARGIL